MKWVKHDLYAFNPTYEWTSYKTNVGMVLSYVTVVFILFYMFITTRDYVVRPPELVSQGDIDLLQVAEEYPFAIPKVGLRVAYTNDSDPTDRITALENENPYVRFSFRHVTVRDQVRIKETELAVEPCIVSSIPSLCPILNTTQMLQGTFYKRDFMFMEITVSKCVDQSACDPLSEINEKIHSGQFRIRAQVSLEAEQFDVELFHKTGIGSAVSNRSLEFFGLPDLEVQGDIILKARKVSKEQRYAGSPPMPETETNILTFDRRETNYRPRSTMSPNLMTFNVRLDDNVRLEEVSYWCPSILDLFGLWGAMASFAASLSIGFVAMNFNKWSFNRHFRHVAHEKRREAQLLTLSAMEWMRKKESHPTTRNREDIYKSLQAQHDALIVEPDIRLFESHHFDVEGRVAMSAAELKYPSTAFGELRRLAILEHGKKRRAAEFLSLWYGRLLVKKGFIKDPERRRELFCATEAIPHYADLLSAKNNHGIKSWLRAQGIRSPQFLRRRKRGEAFRGSAGIDPITNHDWAESDIETGSRSDKARNEERDENNMAISSGVCTGSQQIESDSQHEALRVIAKLDPLTKTDE